MHLNSILVQRDCPELANCPPASCPGSCDMNTEICSIVAQSCPNTCESTRCDPKPSTPSGSSGPSPGALAGAVIGALLFLVLVVLGYLYYRRRDAAKESAAKEKAAAEVKPDLPARADTVLSRPDPHFGARASANNGSEKPPSPLQRAVSGDATELGTVRVYSNHSNGTINLDPSQASRRQSGTPSARSNPFADNVSIQTASDRTQSTNVIPIALVAPGGHSPDGQADSRSSTPSRPPRSPEIMLNDTDLEHVAVSDGEMDNLRLPYAASARSGVSGKSFMTTSSTASDYDEPTQIMTPRQGVVRQVFGVSQAQVVQVPSTAGTGQSSMPTSPTSPPAKPRSTTRSSLAARSASRASKATVGRSPLAQQSFTPADIPLANREPASPTSTVTTRGNPFSDSASPNRDSFADSSRSTDTFGSPTEYHSEGPFTPRPGATFADAQSRPVSTASTADGVSIRADIGTASRVILGMQSSSALSPGYIQSRATSMQTNSGRTIASVDRDDDEESMRRHSLISAKTTSSHADSILSSFPFVPPSPISALPPRSPGAGSPGNSPLSTGSTFARQQAMNGSVTHSPPVSPTVSETRSAATTARPAQAQPSPPIPPVPRQNFVAQAERATSTFSTSTASGLETYPFQFGTPAAPTPTADTQRGSRASLDTLALSRDLAAFPLEYEHGSYPTSQKGEK